MHAWDCPCGTRNAPKFPACRKCGTSIRYGRSVMPEYAPSPVPHPNRHAFGPSPTRFIAGGIVLILGAFVHGSMTWLWLGIFVALVGAIWLLCLAATVGRLPR